MTRAEALDLALSAHSGQVGTTRDKDEPFIYHPLRVASLIDSRYEGNDFFSKESAIIVAILHDVFEDTDVTLDSIRNRLSRDEADALHRITRREGQSYLEHIQECGSSPLACYVKRYDLLEKFGSTKGSLHDKYEMALYILQRYEDDRT